MVTKEEGTRVDWSTPHDEWLKPLLNKARYCGPIEFTALPSVVQLHIDAYTEKQLQLARLDAKIEEHKPYMRIHTHSMVNGMHESKVYANKRVAELTAQKAHLTTKGGDHE